jgi:putative ABC transport system ATP-binding protein
MTVTCRQTMVTPTDTLLRLDGVSKIYGAGDTAVHALRDVDLSIDAGEFVALMGASGSGKSTCLNILGCLDVPTRGEYYFRGVPVSQLERDERALLRGRHLGFVFQGFNLLPRTSAADNVELPLIYLGVGRRERRRRALAALDRVGLAERANHQPTQLSGGQQQRVAIARALVTAPSVLLADEPTGNIDTARRHDILRLLSELNRERNLTIVMVTHEPDMAAYAGRLIRFQDGSIIEDRRQVPAPAAPPVAPLEGDRPCSTPS